MLRSVSELYGYQIVTLDDLSGQVDDFLFDDMTWSLRYLVVDTGTWLPGRKVLISPLALEQPDWETQSFPVRLTQEQVENSPDIDTNQPISRQQEAQLVEHYQWPAYWRDVTPLDAGYAGVRPEAYLDAMEAAGKKKMPEEEIAEQAVEGEYVGDPHLRSTKEVISYHIQARDGTIGHVDDFVVDDESWVIRYLVTDTRAWLPGKKVLIAPQWIDRISWADSRVFVDLLQETIKNGPEFDPSMPINREYEARLYDYYGRPTYWS